MRILGLTGGIAMGKSTAAKALMRQGVPVHDADGAVHRLYARGGRGVGPIGAAFPDAVVEGAVDRVRLGKLVLAAPEKLRLLELIMHPLVRRETRDWLGDMARRGRRLVVLDIPLLYETGGQRSCDAVLVVSAPIFLQRQRALARAGMNEEKLASILSRQVKDLERRRQADYVILTGVGRARALRQLRRILAKERGRRGRVWSPRFGTRFNGRWRG